MEVDLGFKQNGGTVRLSASGDGTWKVGLGVSKGELKLDRLPAALSVHATGVNSFAQRLRTLIRFWAFLLRGR